MRECNIVLLGRLALWVSCLNIGPLPAVAAPPILVGRQVPPSQRIEVAHLDHSAWSALLRKYVDHSGMVNYAAWKANAADRQLLTDYLGRLSLASVGDEAAREARLAFWINAYNALTVQGILREYPTTSIRNHTARFYGYNIWRDLRLVVMNRNYSLEEIEHEVLRKMGEPRVHFGMVCASLGCPRLLNEAYTAGNLDSQLTANTKAFFADRNRFRCDPRRRTIAVSPILRWFAEDFGANLDEQLRWIAPYLPDEQSRRLAESGTARVIYLEYDWGLNEP